MLKRVVSRGSAVTKLLCVVAGVVCAASAAIVVLCDHARQSAVDVATPPTAVPYVVSASEAVELDASPVEVTPRGEMNLVQKPDGGRHTTDGFLLWLEDRRIALVPRLRCEGRDCHDPTVLLDGDAVARLGRLPMGDRPFGPFLSGEGGLEGLPRVYALISCVRGSERNDSVIEGTDVRFEHVSVISDDRLRQWRECRRAIDSLVHTIDSPPVPGKRDRFQVACEATLSQVSGFARIEPQDTPERSAGGLPVDSHWIESETSWMRWRVQSLAEPFDVIPRPSGLLELASGSPDVEPPRYGGRFLKPEEVKARDLLQRLQVDLFPIGREERRRLIVAGGLCVVSLPPDGAAARAGLREGDVLWRVRPSVGALNSTALVLHEEGILAKCLLEGQADGWILVDYVRGESVAQVRLLIPR